ncbi:hypothetical protein HDU76_005861 [Blyttiomyces sp. JEL0837]|nr:hypothetical protein HDU76_005861 [Blyttiomyces sp. JEL0837]
MVKQKATAPPPKEPPKDQFIFRYLKFQCIDIKKTQDFYQSLGMAIDWQVKQIVKPPTPPDQPSNAGHGGNQNAASTPSQVKESVLSNSTGTGVRTQAMGAGGAEIKKVEPNLKAGDATGGKAGADGGDAAEAFKTRTLFSMSFRLGNAAEAADQNHTQLVFEYYHPGDEKEGSEAKTKEEPVPPPTIVMERRNTIQTRTFQDMLAQQQSLKQNDKGPKLRSNEYLVIYVHFLARLMKRLAAKSCDVVVPPTDVADMKVSIVKDPNNVEVRLIELTEAQLEDNLPGPKKQWFARLGYYTVPTNHSDHTIRFYERIFTQNPANVNAGKKDGTNRTKMQRNAGKSTAGGKGGDQHGAPTTQGIHLVDTEELIVGLTKTQFFWLGNEPRSLGCSICFSEKSRADTQSIVQLEDRSKSPLLGIGVEVVNLDSTIKRWEWERPSEIAWEQGRTKITGIGQFSRFKDKLNDLWIEMFMPKAVDPQESHKDDKSKAADLKTAGSSDFLALKEKEINFQHLAGMAKTLSEGAIQSVRSTPSTKTKNSKVGTAAKDDPGFGLPTSAGGGAGASGGGTGIGDVGGCEDIQTGAGAITPGHRDSVARAPHPSIKTIKFKMLKAKTDDNGEDGVGGGDVDRPSLTGGAGGDGNVTLPPLVPGSKPGTNGTPRQVPGSKGDRRLSTAERAKSASIGW